MRRGRAGWGVVGARGLSETEASSGGRVGWKKKRDIWASLVFRFRLLTRVEVPRLVSMRDDLCLGSGGGSVEREARSGEGFICTSEAGLTAPLPFLGCDVCCSQLMKASVEANSFEAM